MKIVFLETPTSKVQGDQVYRTRQPASDFATIFGADVVSGSFLSPRIHEDLETADIVWLCQTIDVDLLALMARRRKRRLITIMEINDNFFETQPFGRVGSFYHDASIQALTCDLARQADALVLSTQALADLFNPLNKCCAIIENAAGDTFSSKRPVKKAITRIGWGGSAGHRFDWPPFVPALEAFLRNNPSITFAAMGPLELKPLFAQLPVNQVEWNAPGSLRDYQRFLTTLDIGLAPLTKSAFAMGRSDVKFMEYTLAGVPSVLSASAAYRRQEEEDLAEIAAGPEEMFAKVSFLLTHPSQSQLKLKRAQRWIDVHRNREQLARRRLCLVQDCQRRLGFPVLERHEGLKGQWRHLEPTRLELLLIGALQRQGDFEAAQPYLLEAITHAPSFYIPRLYLGNQSSKHQNRVDGFLRAHALAPHAAAPELYLAQHQSAQEPHVALERLTQLCLRYPRHTMALESLAKIQQQLGLLEKSYETIVCLASLREDDPTTHLRLCDTALQLAEAETMGGPKAAEWTQEASKVLHRAFELALPSQIGLDMHVLKARIARQEKDWAAASRLLAPFLQTNTKTAPSLAAVALPLLAEAAMHCGNLRAAALAVERLKRTSLPEKSAHPASP